MVKVKAYIKLYKEGRKVPFSNGYRPLFSFEKDVNTSGSIEIIESKKFYPGDEGIVEVLFLSRDYLGKNFGVNSHFTFGEGNEPIGEGSIVEILNG